MRSLSEQLVWLGEGSTLLQDTSNISLEALKHLEAAGRALQPHPKVAVSYLCECFPSLRLSQVHAGMERLCKLHERLDAWESRAQAFLEPQPGANKPGLLEVRLGE